MLTINYEKCTGCGACIQKCPKECISWEIKEVGIKYPIINEDICVDCGICEKICPINNDIKIITKQKAYAAVHREKDTLNKSTSGGAFTSIANYVLDRNGVVYGVSMNSEKKVEHIRIDNKNELNNIRGSKYVQSDTGITYKSAERDLKKGLLVLYSGTPCQIDGLKSFLKKEYLNLITIDIVCHGVGSQKYFDKYLDFAQEKYGEIQELKFRDKEFVGWSCGGGVVVVSSNNNSIRKPYYDYENYYYAYFLSGDIYRKSCYTCKYANMNRVGDITLGDYWGVEALGIDLNTSEGCSLILANTDVGEKILHHLDDIEMVETTLEQATHCNKQLVAPSALPNSRKKRIKEYETMSALDIQKVYKKEHKKYVLKGKIKSMMPYKLKLFIRSKRK